MVTTDGRPTIAWADVDRRKPISEAEFERIADARVQRRLERSSAYRNAANAEEQSEAEAKIERDVIADIERDYRVVR